MSGPMDSRRKTYWPPAFGYIAAISPYASAPSTVMMLESTQARISHIGDGTPRAMLAEVMKIPDPIIDPATSIVASVRDIALTKPGEDPAPDCGVASVVTAELLMQAAEKARRASPAGTPGAFFGANLAKCREALRVSLERGRRIHGGSPT